MKIIQFYEDYNIPHRTEGHKHCRPGWVQIKCPFCTGNPGWHLGYNYIDGYYRCWRCGWKPETEVISKLLNTTDHQQISSILREYKGFADTKLSLKDAKILASKPFKLPSYCGGLKKTHRQYLVSRGFDPDQLEIEWGLLGTTAVSSLDGSDYKWRIIAPIHYKSAIVSFQSRSINPKEPRKYKACLKARETIHHRNILYGIDKAKKDTVIVVEGIFDVWRIGPGAVSTFGVQFSLPQLQQLSKFKKVWVLYDNDPPGRQKGRELAATLCLVTDAEYLPVSGAKDPADLSPGEAKQLRKDLL